MIQKFTASKKRPLRSHGSNYNYFGKSFFKRRSFRSGGEISLRLFREIFAKGKTKQFPEKQAFKKQFAKII